MKEIIHKYEMSDALYNEKIKSFQLEISTLKETY